MGLLVKKYQTGNKADFDPYAGLYSTMSEEASSTNQVPQNIRNLQEEQAKKAQVIADAKEAKEKKARRAKEIEEEIRIRRENPDMVKGISDVEAEKLSERSDRLENPTIGDRLEQLGKAPARYITNPLKILGDIDNAMHGNTQLPSTIKERDTDIKSKLYNTPEEKKKLDALKKEELTDISINAAIEAGTLGAGKLGSLLYKQGKKVARAKNISKIANDNAPKPTLDWGKWNKGIPEDKSLMKEYGAIEAAAKKDGTWMKNADDTHFKGSNPTKEELAQHGIDMTPEEAIQAQFIQQRSKNFKKHFPEWETAYHGTHQRDLVDVKNNLNRRQAFGEGLYTTKNKEEAAKRYALVGKREDSRIHTLAVNTKNKTTFPDSREVQEGLRDWNKSNILSRDEALNKYKKSLGKDKLEDWEVREFLEHIPVKENMPSKFKNLGDVVELKDRGWLLTKGKPKSLIGNRGTFDTSNSNIYKAIAAPVGFTGLVASILNNKE